MDTARLFLCVFSSPWLKDKYKIPEIKQTTVVDIPEPVYPQASTSLYLAYHWWSHKRMGVGKDNEVL